VLFFTPIFHPQEPTFSYPTVFTGTTKKNQSHGQTAPGKTLLENSPKAFAPINTRAEIAKIANVSPM